MVTKMRVKRSANVGVCHTSGICTPSVRLFKTRRLLADLHPEMYNFHKDVHFPYPRFVQGLGW